LEPAKSGKREKGRWRKKFKAKGPACGAEALAKSDGLPAAPAVDRARFASGVILSDQYFLSSKQ